MKKVYLALLTAFIFVVAPIAQLQALPTKIVIRNNYGATIKYTEEYPTGSLLGMGNKGLEIPIENGKERTLGEIGMVRMFPEVKIRTTGQGSGYGLSPYTSLKPQLAQIGKDYKNYPKATEAVIVVGPSSAMNPYWNLSVRYE